MKKEKNFFIRTGLSLLLVVFLVFTLGSVLLPKPTQAELGGMAGGTHIKTADGFVLRDSMRGRIQAMQDALKQFNWNDLQASLKTAGSKALGNAIRTTLKQMAFDTATYLASGGEGQSALFYKEGWTEFLPNVMDSAAGSFIEDLGKQGVMGTKFNLCEPGFDVRLRIGLGLDQQRRPSAPSCTWTKMSNAWKNEADKWAAMSQDDFLKTFQSYFDPRESDLGISLTLQSQMANYTNRMGELEAMNREESDGWLEFTGLKLERKNFPNASEQEFRSMFNRGDLSLFQYTGDSLIDAANVFMNQFAYELVKRALRKLTENSSQSTPSGGTPAWLSSNAGPYNSGVEGAKDQFKRILEPNFNERGDYDILAELTLCPDPTKAGPTNCVITSDFQTAVTEKMTVGEAVNAGYLNGNGIFGFTSDGLEPSYQEGFPYRSMMILRKFRILPVGWEVAAEYLKDHMNQMKGAKNLRDMLACYEDGDNDGFGTYFNTSCEGLVDPSWVLKAPQNYCRREGPGPEITSESITGEGDDSERNITRNEEYCGDEQSCIKEDANGNCRAYGYCTEEKRVWKFDSESCTPNFNTCETFSNSGGQSFSYLKNTLDYGSCTIESAGCTGYCEERNSSGDYNCSINGGDKVFLNSKAKTCDSEDDGCSEFIRFRAGLGANYIKNSSFEDLVGSPVPGDDDFTFWGVAGDAVPNAYHGQFALGLNSNFSTSTIVGPATFVVANQSYTLSFYARNCSSGDFFELGSATSSLEMGDNWNFYQLNYNYPLTALDNTVTFSINTNSCVIDALKLESGVEATTYSDYREEGLVYQKLAPDHLSCDGNSDPDECDDYVRKCSEPELGCSFYTSVEDEITIPAKVSNENYCPAECVGYDDYLQTETNFDSKRFAYIIPDNENKCSAQSVGCDEFTNLDTLEQGAESREYYSEMRHCRNPDGQCAEFYTWEGSSESGFQLKVFSLEEDDDSNDSSLPDAGAQYPQDPAVTEYDYALCNEDIYNLPSTDPGYNSDCREFYNSNGNISYHLNSKTISCSDNCHPYRRTGNNIVKDGFNNNLSVAACNALTSDPAAVYHDGDQCFFCKNGGEWSSEHEACIYMAIPDEGKKCQSSQVGCREYSGNTGGNMRIIFNHDFELASSTQSWEGDLGTPSLSSDSLIAGGHSLNVQGGLQTISLKLGSIFNKNTSYVLSFIAKGGGNITDIGIGPDTANLIDFVVSSETASLNSNWQLYEFNLARLNNALDNYEVSVDDQLFIVANSDFLIDNIRLTEIVDRYYFIKKDYWNVPGICEYDVFGVWRGSEYNLGCEEYTDEDDQSHFLKGFTNLCSDSAVGCELVVNTQNYTSPLANTWNLFVPSDASEESVLADTFEYIVYDQDKSCNETEKGCERLGKPDTFIDNVLYSDVYLINNPDEYDTNLCLEDQDGCELWYDAEGEATTFKDPGNMVCEYRQKENAGQSSWDWFKRRMYMCDIDDSGQIDAGETEFCSLEGGCLTGTCILDTNDNICTTTSKTFGIGGQGAMVDQPSYEDVGGDYYSWAGVCPVSESGCTEYIDPISIFSSNMLFNSNCRDIDGLADWDCADGWSSSASGYTQTVGLTGGTLYTLRLQGSAGSATVSNVDGLDLRVLQSDNTTVNIPSVTVSGNDSVVFYVEADGEYEVLRPDSGDDVQLKKTVISYQKESAENNDCNGNVNYSNGCVLFDKRAVTGGGNTSVYYQTNLYDADLTLLNYPNLVPDSGPTNDSNVLLKVTADRTCAEWLACRSFIKDERGENVCYDLGLCDSLDENDACNNFVLSEEKNQAHPDYISSSEISNLSGYSIVGENGGSLQTDFYPLGSMNQVGQVAKVSNGGFETVGNNGYPIGWNWYGGSWNEGVFSVISNPVAAQTEGVGYAPEGENFLKLGSSFSATSEYIGVVGGLDEDYIISANINTKNLSTNSAVVDIEQFSLGGASLGVQTEVLALEAGQDWTFKLNHFPVNNNTVNIKITLRSDGGTIGNFYFDDIQIRPGLIAKDNTPTLSSDDDYSYIPQTCRIYPEDDSLSCDYYEDSGIRRKGWRGYCLEYDRYPGSPYNCIEWYPVDKVKGDGIEEGAGYQGKYPVYYCTQSTQETTDVLLTGLPGCSGGASCTATIDLDNYYNFPPDDDILAISQIHITAGGHTPTNLTWGADESVTQRCTYAPYASCFTDFCSIYSCDCCDDKYAAARLSYDPSTHVITIEGYVENWSTLTSSIDNVRVTITEIRERCNTVVQTVSSTGANKYWSGRVYENSDFEVDCNSSLYSSGMFRAPLSCDYSSDDTPFGSLVPPFPSNNPFEWDSNDDIDGKQPLYYVKSEYSYIDSSGTDVYVSETPEAARSGQIYNVNNIKRLFAKSFGVWNWVDSGSGMGDYVESSSGNWSSIMDRCTDNIRNYSTPGLDLCAVIPVVDSTNIYIEGSSADFTVVKNGIINLTFTSKVDSQQLPLVMYGVDWGDNEETVVSGVEMRSHPQLFDPHSLYHLYSYWDMKRKNSFNQDNNSIYCGSGGNTTAYNFNNADSIVLSDAPSKDYCVVTPRVKIKDNWGWCNGVPTDLTNPALPEECNYWEESNGRVIVTES